MFLRNGAQVSKIEFNPTFSFYFFEIVGLVDVIVGVKQYQIDIRTVQFYYLILNWWSPIENLNRLFSF